ncbi:MAG TPA: HEAT repeat domain-containing protein [Pyrinomonadaceae bacterium]|nr:HEAT repeat domain-containing protein [Pyrinomonadaceae bacterium]
MLALFTVIWLALVPLTSLPQAEQSFTPVQGATLQAKFDAAAQQAATGRQARFWTAYSFDVRPGVAVDVDFVSEDGSFRIQGTWDSFGSGSHFYYDSVGNFPGLETRSLGVFALRDSAGAVERVDVLNLARRHEYAGYPVYWAGRASNEESLNFLRGLAETKGAAYSGRREGVASEAVRALTLHDDRRVPETLQHIARTSTDEDVRAQAVRSLGTPPVADAVREYLAQLARDERESSDVRRAAVSAYGRGRDAQALSFLQTFYASVTNKDLRRAALTQIARNDNRQGAATFLIKVATQDSDPEARKTALARLGEIAGEQALGALTRTATSSDADTELQKQAVNAIARRPASESVPLLINIARTHAKPEVRRQAFVLLGRTNDPAAVDFLKSVLTK